MVTRLDENKVFLQEVTEDCRVAVEIFVLTVSGWNSFNTGCCYGAFVRGTVDKGR